MSDEQGSTPEAPHPAVGDEELSPRTSLVFTPEAPASSGYAPGDYTGDVILVVEPSPLTRTAAVEGGPAPSAADQPSEITDLGTIPGTEDDAERPDMTAGHRGQARKRRHAEPAVRGRGGSTRRQRREGNSGVPCSRR